MGQRIRALLRWLIRGGFRWYERVYRRVHGLQAIGPLLYVGRTHYRGPSKVLADDTRLEPRDPIGVLHFNNICIDGLHQSGVNVPFAFARLLRASLRALAHQLESDPVWREVKVFRGITWLPPHGQRFGFETEPLLDRCRAPCLGWHFRLLLYAFSPVHNQRRARRLTPYVFWLTRRQLVQRFAHRKATT